MASASETRATSPGGHFLGPALGIFALAFLVRLAHLWQLRAAPFFSLKLGDAASYDSWARGIAAGDWLGSEAFYQAPLYPYWLGTVYALLGDGPLLVRLCQAALGALSCVLLALAGARFFSRRAGILAGLLLALYAPAIFLDGLIQKSVLDLFFLCLALGLAGRLVDEPRRLAAWGGLGAALGCLILTRENALVFLAAAFVWLATLRRNLGGRRLAAGGALLLGAALVLAPVGLRNWVVSGELHLTTAQFGPNFYIGNNELSDGRYRPLRFGRGDARFERRDATALAEVARGRKLSAAEVSAYWTKQALGFIASQPGAWLALMARKFALLWNATEVEDTEDQYSHADWSLPLRVTGTLLHFGVLAPLALLGVAVTWGERRRLTLLYLMTIAYAGSVVLFYVFARYRYPLIPFLVLFAAGGLAGARGFLRGRPPRQLAAAAAALGAVAVFCNWPLTSIAEMRALTERNVGATLALERRLDDAVRHLRRSLEYDPGSAVAHFNLANALAARDEVEEAIEHYRIALRIKPDFAEAHANLGNWLAGRGRVEEAASHFRAALRAVPDPSQAAYVHLNLALLLRQQGNLDGAIHHYREAVVGLPDSAAAHFELGATLLLANRASEAALHFSEAVRLRPDSPAALNNLAWVLATDAEARDVPRAIRTAERACELTGRREPGFLDTLSVAYAAAGRFQDANATAHEALELARNRGNEALVEKVQGRLERFARGQAHPD